MDDDAVLASLAFVAGQRVEIDAVELNAALRRALVVRAVGGNPQRELTLDEEAVLRLAAELDTPDRRAALARGLESLRPKLADRQAAIAALESLLADAELAWRCFAAAQIADEVS